MKRQEILTLRVTADEKREIERKAEVLHVSIGEFLRRSAFLVDEKGLNVRTEDGALHVILPLSSLMNVVKKKGKKVGVS